MSIFRNRVDAGKRLAASLSAFAHQEDVVVLALPRGGVPVAYEVAKALDLPMDIFVVRKLGVPGQKELAMGAIASGGIRIVNEAVVQQAGLSDEDIAAAAAQEQVVLERRENKYRQGRSSIDPKGKTTIVVDDGMATGSTMQVTVLALKRLKPSRIVIAVPVAAKEACAELKEWADQVICLETPVPFWAVGQWYQDFSQTTDEEVLSYMDKAKAYAQA
jgi:predicted phosphoribosyltransferase